jgi:hypothetical protein
LHRYVDDIAATRQNYVDLGKDDFVIVMYGINWLPSYQSAMACFDGAKDGE